MIQHDAGIERRLTDLKSELAASIERWREQRDAEAKVPPPSPVSRSHDPRPDPSSPLLRLLERDWSHLRESHEAALRELRDHAHTLSRVTIAAANTSVNGFEQAEARLAETAQSLSTQMTGLSDQLVSVASEFRASQEATQKVVAAAAMPAALAPVSERPAPVELAPTDDDAPPSRTIGMPGALVAVTAVLLLAAGVTGWKAWSGARDALARAADSQQQVEVALQQAQQELAASRNDAHQRDQELDRLRAGTARAEVMAGVLAAPDLVRYAVSGGDASGAAGQVLWSRSRGVVLSASRIPQPPDGMIYQLWLQTSRGVVSLGVFTPDEGGRATLTADPPSSIPPVVGALVTVEPSGGSAEPSERVLAQSATRSSS